MDNLGYNPTYRGYNSIYNWLGPTLQKGPKIPTMLHAPSRERVQYPILGTARKSSTQKCRLGGDMLVPRRVVEEHILKEQKHSNFKMPSRQITIQFLNLCFVLLENIFPYFSPFRGNSQKETSESWSLSISIYHNHHQTLENYYHPKPELMAFLGGFPY